MATNAATAIVLAERRRCAREQRRCAKGSVDDYIRNIVNEDLSRVFQSADPFSRAIAEFCKADAAPKR